MQPAQSTQASPGGGTTIGPADIEALVNENYDLGMVNDVEELHGGLVNRSFLVRTQSAGEEAKFLVRLYSEAATEAEIRFEHAFLLHLAQRGFRIASGVRLNRDGRSFQRLDEHGPDDPSRFVSVFEFCRGEARYTWMENRCTEGELRSAARAFADLHHASADLRVEDLNCAKPRIMEYLAGAGETLSRYEASPDHGSFAAYFRSQLPSIRAVLTEGLGAESQMDGLLILPLHCDFHPGNMTFLDGELCGLFDFDWAKIDYRVYDVAVAIIYFFSCCQGSDKGTVRLNDILTFVEAYQDRASALSDPGPMTKQELAVLPRMMANANLFLLIWDLDCYFLEHRDEDEYLGYLRNYISVMQDIETRLLTIEAALLELAPVRMRPG
jgi:homoserine kinase type II